MPCSAVSRPTRTRAAPRSVPSSTCSAYLRTLDSQGADLPAAFLEQLRSALLHYDVATLDPTRTLRDALLALFKGHQRSELQVPVIRAVLERRLAVARTLAPGSPAFLRIIEQLIAAVQGRFPDLADLARDVHYRYVEQPAFERMRGTVQAKMIDRLARLASKPEGSDAESWRAELVACPQPLRTVFAANLARSSQAVQRMTLEVMLRRDYRFRQLERVRHAVGLPWPFVLASYPHEGQTHRRRVHGRPVRRCALGAGGAARRGRVVARRARMRRRGVPLGVRRRRRSSRPPPCSATNSSRSAFDRPLRRVVFVLVAGAGRRSGAGTAVPDVPPVRARDSARTRSSGGSTRCRASSWSSRGSATSSSSACPRPKTCTCSRVSRAKTRATSVSSRSSRCARPRRCGTVRAVWSACRTSSGWRSRRSRPSAGRS